MFIPLQRFRKTTSNMVAVVQLVRASDCGSECRRFESDQPPTRKKQKCLFLFLLCSTYTKQKGEHHNNALPFLFL